jgi:hypothetical protein
MCYRARRSSASSNTIAALLVRLDLFLSLFGYTLGIASYTCPLILFEPSFTSEPTIEESGGRTTLIEVFYAAD